jgi:hypothetical protein
MLFRGLTAQDAVAWESVKPKLNEGSIIWRSIILGASTNQYFAGEYFRVLELGGMEVY